MEVWPESAAWWSTVRSSSNFRFICIPIPEPQQCWWHLLVWIHTYTQCHSTSFLNFFRNSLVMVSSPSVAARNRANGSSFSKSACISAWSCPSTLRKSMSVITNNNYTACTQLRPLLRSTWTLVKAGEHGWDGLSLQLTFHIQVYRFLRSWCQALWIEYIGLPVKSYHHITRELLTNNNTYSSYGLQCNKTSLQ